MIEIEDIIGEWLKENHPKFRQYPGYIIAPYPQYRAVWTNNYSVGIPKITTWYETEVGVYLNGKVEIWRPLHRTFLYVSDPKFFEQLELALPKASEYSRIG